MNLKYPPRTRKDLNTVLVPYGYVTKPLLAMYHELVNSFGGEVNAVKTLTSTPGIRAHEATEMGIMPVGQSFSTTRDYGNCCLLNHTRVNLMEVIRKTLRRQVKGDVSAIFYDPDETLGESLKEDGRSRVKSGEITEWEREFAKQKEAAKLLSEPLFEILFSDKLMRNSDIEMVMNNPMVLWLNCMTMVDLAESYKDTQNAIKERIETAHMLRLLTGEVTEDLIDVDRVAPLRIVLPLLRTIRIISAAQAVDLNIPVDAEAAALNSDTYDMRKSFEKIGSIVKSVNQLFEKAKPTVEAYVADDTALASHKIFLDEMPKVLDLLQRELLAAKKQVQAELSTEAIPAQVMNVVFLGDDEDGYDD